MHWNLYTWAFLLFTSIWKAATGARIEPVSLGSAAHALNLLYMAWILPPNSQMWRHSCGKIVYFSIFIATKNCQIPSCVHRRSLTVSNIWKFVTATRIDPFAPTNSHAKFAPCGLGFSHWTTGRLNYSLISCTIKHDWSGYNCKYKKFSLNASYLANSAVVENILFVLCQSGHSLLCFFLYCCLAYNHSV